MLKSQYGYKYIRQTPIRNHIWELQVCLLVGLIVVMDNPVWEDNINLIYVIESFRSLFIQIREMHVGLGVTSIINLLYLPMLYFGIIMCKEISKALISSHLILISVVISRKLVSSFRVSRAWTCKNYSNTKCTNRKGLQ